MIGQGLLLLVIPAVALHLMVLVLESNSSITRVAQHELLRRLRVWFLIFAFIGLCLCLISTPLIVMAPFILTGILMAMKIKRHVAERRFTKAVQLATPLSFDPHAVSSALVPLSDRSEARRGRKIAKHYNKAKDIALAARKAKVAMSLAEYLELMFSTLTISQKDVKQKDVDTTPEEGFHSYISFCRALRYITLIFLFATVMTYFYDAFLGPILSQFDSEFELAASRNRSIRMAMTDLLPTAISRFGHVLFVAPIALLLIIANVVTWSTTFRLWSFRRFMRWKFFGSVWQAMTIQAIADQLQSGASLQNVLDSSKESHPISQLKKQSRILAKLSGDNDALLKWLQRFRWVEPSPLPASHVANPKMLATLFQRQASLLRQRFDNFWTLAARYIRVLGTLYIGAVALWLASEVVILLVDVTYYVIP